MDTQHGDDTRQHRGGRAAARPPRPRVPSVSERQRARTTPGTRKLHDPALPLHANAPRVRL